MRKLLWFTLGFGTACALSVYFLTLSVRFVLIALLLPVVFGLLWGFRSVLLCQKLGILCAGLVLGLLWYAGYDLLYLSTARELDGKTEMLSVCVSDFGFETDYGVAADGKIEHNGKTYRIRFYMNDAVNLTPGDVVSGSFRIRYTAKGGAEKPTHHGSEGQFLLAYPESDIRVEKAGTTSWKYLGAYLRQYLTKTIEAVFPHDTVAFVKALLMGDTSGLDYETDTQLKLSGIRHVAAVSGLHVSILFSIVYLITGKHKIWTAVLGVPVLVVFAAMGGFSASIIRACMMQLLMLLAILCKREYDPPIALAFAAFIMLLGNPYVITSVGFQLSVGSVAGIFAFSGRIYNWLLDVRRLGRLKRKKRVFSIIQKMAASVSVSLGALVLTVPLTAWYFATVSMVSVLTNLLCLWVITLLFCGIVAVCILGVVYIPLGKAIAWLLAWLVRYVLGVSKFLSSFPLSAIYTDSVYIVLWLVMCYCLLGVFLLSKRKNAIVLLSCTLAGLCIALLASWAEPLLDTYRVTVLDVGQGQCVVLQSEGKTYVVDCGGSNDKTAADTAASYLLSQGVTYLDGLVLTHYDRDHVGAAAYLISRISTDLLILPQSSGAQEWENTFMSEQIPQIIRAEDDMLITWGKSCITVYSSQNIQTSNESSLCVLFQTEKCDILITGDRSISGEMALVRRTHLPKLDALIVGHHGSNDSTGSLLLQVTRPELAIISVGAENAYGHPSKAVLQRLTSYGCQIRRTDHEGTIVLRG